MSEFVEYPKCLYKNADFSGETLTVTTPDQEAAAKAYGWMTCEQIYGIEPMPQPAAPAAQGEASGTDESAPKKKAKK